MQEEKIKPVLNGAAETMLQSFYPLSDVQQKSKAPFQRCKGRGDRSEA